MTSSSVRRRLNIRPLSTELLLSLIRFEGLTRHKLFYRLEFYADCTAHGVSVIFRLNGPFSRAYPAT